MYIKNTGCFIRHRAFSHEVMKKIEAFQVVSKTQKKNTKLYLMFLCQKFLKCTPRTRKLMK